MLLDHQAVPELRVNSSSLDLTADTRLYCGFVILRDGNLTGETSSRLCMFHTAIVRSWYTVQTIYLSWPLYVLSFLSRG